MSDGAVLQDVLRRLDAGILLHLAGPDPSTVPVLTVAIHDRADNEFPSAAVLLAPGVAPEEPEAAGIITGAASAGVAAVVLRGSQAPDGAGNPGVCLLGVDPALSWDRLFLLLSAALDSAQADLAGQMAGGGSSGSGEAQRLGDLFALADAMAGAIDASVLVMDAQNRVLAFSSGQPTDEWRQSTILGRRVPAEWEQRFRREGLYEQIQLPGAIVSFEMPDVPEFKPRRATGVHAGGRRIGSIAIAQAGRPFDDRTDEALREAARIAALPLLRHATRHAVGAHRQDERLRELLSGGGNPASAVARLGLPTSLSFSVISVAARTGVEESGLEGMGTALRMSLPPGVEGATVLDGSRLYVLASGDDEALRRMATEPDWFTRSGAAERGMAAGVARPVARPDAIAAAREEADRVTDAMLAGIVTNTVASPEQSWPFLVLADVERLMRSEDAMRYGRAAALAEHDRSHGTDYVHTLSVFLQHRGDSASSAEALHVHPNTLRYRVKRACEIAGIDLDQPVERLVVELQLSALLR